ncbi:MAG: hypothetical protein ACTHLN_12440, partial [Tepidisphaeraceae bacterium]
ADDGKRIGSEQSRNKQRVAHVHLKGLAPALANFGLISKSQHSPLRQAECLLKDRLRSLQDVGDKSTRSVRASLCHGTFLLEYQPLTRLGAGKQWLLTNPGQTVPRMPGSGNIVGYFSSPFWAVWQAVERTVLSQQITIAYSDIDQNVLVIADAITTGITIADDSKELITQLQ